MMGLGCNHGMGTPKTARQIDVQIFPSFEQLLDPPWIQSVAKVALDIADPVGRSSVSIVVADEPTVHSINLKFRGLDEPTDVLSFGYNSDSNGTDFTHEFPVDPDGSEDLGEVILCYPLASRQAIEHNVSTPEELALLTIHGVFHLLGYDHDEAEAEAAMQHLERQALAIVFDSPNPVDSAK